MPVVRDSTNHESGLREHEAPFMKHERPGPRPVEISVHSWALF